MHKLFALAAAVLSVACTTLADPDDDLLEGGYATPYGAAFLGYYSPVYREPTELER